MHTRPIREVARPCDRAQAHRMCRGPKCSYLIHAAAGGCISRVLCSGRICDRSVGWPSELNWQLAASALHTATLERRGAARTARQQKPEGPKCLRLVHVRYIHKTEPPGSYSTAYLRTRPRTLFHRKIISTGFSCEAGGAQVVSQRYRGSFTLHTHRKFYWEGTRLLRRV